MSAGLKRLGLAVAAVFAMGFGTLLALSYLIPADTVRERVKAQIQAVTGLDPVLSGDVMVSLFPTGKVRFNGVSLGDQRADTPALTVEEIVVRLRTFPLLTGQIEGSPIPGSSIAGSPIPVPSMPGSPMAGSEAGAAGFAGSSGFL